MIISRAYNGTEDLHSISDFLNETYLLSKDQINWSTARWQYSAYFIHPLHLMSGNDYWTKSIQIWEDNDKIVGVVSYEDKGSVFIQHHPNYPELIETMILWSEENLSLVDEEGVRTIELWINENDEIKRKLASSRGYKQNDYFEYLRWHDLDEVENFVLPTEYTISSLDIFEDVESKCNTIAKAFNSLGLPLELYRSMQSAPLYNPMLDIVVVYKNGEVAACGTMWFNPNTKASYVEPMATLPEHQGKGLGRIVLLEGLKRLKILGAEKAYVGSYGDRTGSFYASCGFNEFERNYPWTKTFK